MPYVTPNYYHNSDENNPCLKEQNLSYKCLSDNDYNKEKCEMYFANYNSCKEFWNKIRLERKRKGIVPNMPPVSERAKIKEDYMNRKLSTER